MMEFVHPLSLDSFCLLFFIFIFENYFLMWPNSRKVHEWPGEKKSTSWQGVLCLWNYTSILYKYTYIYICIYKCVFEAIREVARIRMQIMSLDKNSIFLQSSASFSPPTNHSLSICLYVCALYMYMYMYCMYIENGPRNVANLGLNWTTWLNIRAYIQHLSCIVIKIFFFLVWLYPIFCPVPYDTTQLTDSRKTFLSDTSWTIY